MTLKEAAVAVVGVGAFSASLLPVNPATESPWPFTVLPGGIMLVGRPVCRDDCLLKPAAKYARSDLINIHGVEIFSRKGGDFFFNIPGKIERNRERIDFSFHNGYGIFHLDDLFTLFRENPFREGFNPFLDLSLLLAHVVDLIPFPETEGETIESHFESKKKIGMETDRERREEREGERETTTAGTRGYNALDCVSRTVSLCLCLFPSLRLSHCSVEVLALARFCMRRRSSR